MTVHVTYVYFTRLDPDQAHANQILHTCNALVGRGHRVTLVAAGDVSAYADAHDLPVRFDQLRVPLPDGPERLDRVIYYLAGFSAAHGGDVLLTRDISFLRVVRRIPEALRPCVAYEAHKAYSFVDQLDPAEERARLAATDEIVAISQGVAADLTKLGLDVRAIVPDAADLTQIPDASRVELREELDIDREAEVVVYAGSLVTWKNDLKGLLAAFGTVAADRPRAELLIIGNGDDGDVLSARVSELDVPADRVTFTGYVPQRRVFRYLGAADVGVVPLRTEDRVASHYTSPLKLYEYLVSGLRVVASDVPALAATAADVDGIELYEPGDVDDLARALGEAVMTPGPEHDRNRFSYARRAARLESVLKRALA